jgi:hypothetical protein
VFPSTSLILADSVREGREEGGERERNDECKREEGGRVRRRCGSNEQKRSKSAVRTGEGGVAEGVVVMSRMQADRMMNRHAQCYRKLLAPRGGPSTAISKALRHPQSKVVCSDRTWVLFEKMSEAVSGIGCSALQLCLGLSDDEEV